MTRTMSELTQIIEGALFAANEPLAIEALIKIFNDETKPSLAQVRKCLAQLQENYQNKGIRLVEVATGYRFEVAPEIVPYITKNMAEKPSRFSRAMLETLALIAYRQPITRGEIEEIRGVVASSNIIKTLEEFEWIRIVGHKDVPGKPGLYATTKTFLDHFGLKSLEELPPLAELKELNNWSQEPIAAQTLEVPPEEATPIGIENELVGPVLSTPAEASTKLPAGDTESLGTEYMGQEEAPEINLPPPMPVMSTVFEQSFPEDPPLSEDQRRSHTVPLDAQLAMLDEEVHG